jgi:cytoskeleton protein RodZ
MSDITKNESVGHPDKEQQQDGIALNELSPGAQLSARRQALNWSVEQVAAQLNLAPRQIQAIEADNYAALPGMAIARGFIRSYAKLLNIDAAPLLQVVAKEATPAEEAGPLRRELPNIRFTESRLSPSGRQNMVSRSILGLLLVVFVAGGLFVMLQTGMQARLPSFLQFGAGNAPTVPTPLDQEKSAPEESAAMSDDAANVGSGSAPDSGAGGNDTKRDIPANQVTADGAMPVMPVATGIIPVAPAATSRASTKDMLTLKLREDSWVEIKRPDNSTVVAALFKAGATESFKITGPVVMIVGNAAGVDVTLRGKPIALKANTRSNVAQLNLK